MYHAFCSCVSQLEAEYQPQSGTNNQAANIQLAVYPYCAGPYQNNQTQTGIIHGILVTDSVVGNVYRGKYTVTVEYTGTLVEAFNRPKKIPLPDSIGTSISLAQHALRVQAQNPAMTAAGLHAQVVTALTPIVANQKVGKKLKEASLVARRVASVASNMLPKSAASKVSGLRKAINTLSINKKKRGNRRRP